jgi:hypothetical protein
VNSVVRKCGDQIVRSLQYASGLALVVAFLSFFNIPIGWLSTVIIALVTLQNGPRKGFVVMAWAILPAVAMLSLGQYLLFFNVFVLHYLVIWGLAIFLRRSTWATIIQAVSLLGIIAIFLIYYFAPDLQNWLVSQLTAIVKDYKSISIFNIKAADFDLWVSYISLFGIGLLGLAFIVINLIILFLARWWQSLVTPMVNIQKECYGIRIHYLSSLLLLALAACLYINSSLMANVLVVALVPFIISGLSLFHGYLATKKSGNIIMFIFYILFLFLSPYFVMLLSLMGWIDSFINLRKKYLVDNAIEEKN